MQLQRPPMTVVLVVFVCIVTSITVVNYGNLIQGAIAANAVANTTAILPYSDDITLGSPQLKYTEYDKTTSFRPAIVNGTHGIQMSFTGHGILNGSNITDNGKGFITNITGGEVYTAVRGEVVSSTGGTIGTAGHVDQGIGHYDADGKLRDTGTTFITKATGNLAFIRNMVGIYKDEIDKAGNAITKIWFWK
jgi:hypothetical protein